MRALAPISATASASRLADAVVDASRRREAAGLHRRCRDERTEAYRVMHGVAEGIPGVTVDKYGSTLFVQSWRNPVVRARLLYPYVRNIHSVVGTADTLTLDLNHHSLALQSPDPIHQERGELLELCDAVRANRIDGIGAIDRVWLHPRSTDATRWDDGDPRRGVPTDAMESPAWVGVYDLAAETYDGLRPSRAGKRLDDDALGFVFEELGVKYRFVPPRRFGDPSLFLDFRAARRWIHRRIRSMKSHGDVDGDVDGDVVMTRARAGREVSVLNAFAYTCGAGVVAKRAGADVVLNTDHSQTYLSTGARNAVLNSLEPCASLCLDFYPAMRGMAGLSAPGRRVRGGGRGGRNGGRGRRRPFSEKVDDAAPTSIEPATFDMVVLDPPTLTKTKFGAVDIENDYPSLAKPSALCVKPGGVLVATNHSAKVDLDDWLEVVSRCAVKAGREVLSVETIAPDGPDDDDFPALDDGRRPLKVAAFTLG